jgi:hypothetical protein
VGIGTRIEDDPYRFPCCGFLNRVHNFALVIRLSKFDGKPMALCRPAAKFFHVIKRSVAVGLGFSRAQKVQIRPI